MNENDIVLTVPTIKDKQKIQQVVLQSFRNYGNFESHNVEWIEQEIGSGSAASGIWRGLSKMVIRGFSIFLGFQEFHEFGNVCIWESGISIMEYVKI